MLPSILILVVSAGLFFFYIQTFCERALRREFDRAYFNDVLSAIQLEFPRLREALHTNAPIGYREVRLALKCDYATLSYVLKKSGSRERAVTRDDKALLLYFRFLLFCLPFRYTMKLGAKEATLKLTVLLQYFANSVGEKIGSPRMANMAPDHVA
jgi:hypothetical protein